MLGSSEDETMDVVLDIVPSSFTIIAEFGQFLSGIASACANVVLLHAG